MTDEQFPELRIQKIEIPHVAKGNETANKSLLKDFIPLAIMSAAVVGLGVIGFLAYQSSKAPRDPNEIPVFKADTGPYKIKPQNPGGMDIPNTDKEVFNMIGENADANKTEGAPSVDPLPEEPMARVELKSENPAISSSGAGAEVLAESPDGKPVEPIESATTPSVEKIAKGTVPAVAAAQGTLLPDEMDINAPGEPNVPVNIPARKETPLADAALDLPQVPVAKSQEVVLEGDKPVDANAFDKNVDSMVQNSKEDAKKIDSEDAAKKEIVVVPPKATKAEDLKKTEAKKLDLEPRKETKKVEQAAKATPKSMQKQPPKKERAKKERAKKESTRKEVVLKESVSSDKKAASRSEAGVGTKTSGISGVRVQLGSFRSVKEVDAEWKRLSRRFNEDLGVLSYTAVKANLGAKGVFYRLQVGPVKSNNQARSLCKNLSAQGQACIVVGG